MKNYIGTKLIAALPMTWLDYNIFRGWELPKDENGADEGYLVEYKDGGKPNTTQYEGYVSWSPKEQFDNAYRETSGISIGLAVEALRKGLKVGRAGWNGKNMHLELINNWTDGDEIGPISKALPFIAMRTVDASYVPWLASQTDILADDWQIVG